MKNFQSVNNDWVYLSFDKQPITSSHIVSKVFGKLHQAVMAKIDMLDKLSDFFHRNFTEIKYIGEDGEFKSAYEMTRNGFGFISMDFTGKQEEEFSHAYMDAFDEKAKHQ